MSGVLIGIIVAAPVGPVNLICLRRAIVFGWLNGFLSGSGAALGDGLLAIIAAFGVTAVTEFIRDFSTWLQVLGGVFLIGLGVHTYLTPPSNEREVPDITQARAISVIAATFALTVTNPATMFGFAALFSGVGGLISEVHGPSFLNASILVLSVVAGSLLWWLSLTVLASTFRTSITTRWLVIANHIFGALIGLFGLGILTRILWRLLA